MNNPVTIRNHNISNNLPKKGWFDNCYHCETITSSTILINNLYKYYFCKDCIKNKEFLVLKNYFIDGLYNIISSFYGDITNFIYTTHLKQISIIGVGVVGSAIYKSILNKKLDVIVYDKYKEIGVKNINLLLTSEILFICVPTPYCSIKEEFDKSAIYEICTFLKEKQYKKLVVLKCTVEPGTTESLSLKFNLNIIHNPEFLSQKTAYHDFSNQKHIVLGKTMSLNIELLYLIEFFYRLNYYKAELSIVDSKYSELMKLTVNSFYAVKIQFFNEIYLLCQTLQLSYNTIRDLVLKNGWINKMHTLVPGPDGKLSYGGMCLPKDINSFNTFLEKHNISHDIIKSTIQEQSMFRKE